MDVYKTFFTEFHSIPFRTETHVTEFRESGTFFHETTKTVPSLFRGILMATLLLSQSTVGEI
jgi:hypothetical protein